MSVNGLFISIVGIARTNECTLGESEQEVVPRGLTGNKRANKRCLPMASFLHRPELALTPPLRAAYLADGLALVGMSGRSCSGLGAFLTLVATSPSCYGCFFPVSLSRPGLPRCGIADGPAALKSVLFDARLCIGL